MKPFNLGLMVTESGQVHEHHGVAVYKGQEIHLQTGAVTKRFTPLLLCNRQGDQDWIWCDLLKH